MTAERGMTGKKPTLPPFRMAKVCSVPISWVDFGEGRQASAFWAQ